MALVHQVVDYVDGRDLSLHELLWQGLEEAAESLDFERAARLRRELQASLGLTAAQRRLRESVEAHWAVLVTASPEKGRRELMLILRGRIWAQIRVSEDASPVDVAERLAQCWRRFRDVGLAEPDHDSVDDLHILGSFLSRHEGHPALIRFVWSEDDPDWPGIAARAIGLTAAQLDFDSWEKGSGVLEEDWVDVAEVAPV